MISGTLLSDTSNLYPYTGYLQRVLTCSPLEKQHSLQEEFYFPNATPDTYTAGTTGDPGFNKRYELSKESKEFSMLGQIVSNITTQSRYIVGGNQLRIILRRSQPEFCLDSATKTIDTITGVPWKYDITSAVFFACKRPMTPKILEMHRSLSASSPYMYPVTEMQGRAIVIPSGITSHNSDTIINGKIPRMLVLGIVSQTAFHGSLDKSPFNFQNWDLKEVTFSLNSETLDTRVIPLSFSKNNSGTDSYLQALRSLRKCAANPLLGNGIDVDSYNKGIVPHEYLSFNYNYFNGKLILNIRVAR